MFNKLKAFLELFRAGKQVADPAKWKNRTIKANAVAAVLIALGGVAYSFGYRLPEDTNYEAIAAGIIAIFNIVMHFTTSEKVGLLKQHDTEPTVQSTVSSTDESETFPTDNSRD